MNGERELNPVADAEPIGHAGGPAEQEAARGPRFARHGHELALVGGPVRDVFLGQRPGDLDLTTDATPEQVLQLTRDWADKTWTVGIGRASCRERVSIDV